MSKQFLLQYYMGKTLGHVLGHLWLSLLGVLLALSGWGLGMLLNTVPRIAPTQRMTAPVPRRRLCHRRQGDWVLGSSKESLL